MSIVATHAHRYRPVPCGAVPLILGVGDQGVGSPAGGEEHGRQQAETHRRHRPEPEEHRNGEGAQPKDERCPFVLDELVQVQFEPGDEHELEQPRGAEQLHAAFAHQQAAHTGPDQHPGDHEPDHHWYPGPLGKDGHQ